MHYEWYLFEEGGAVFLLASGAQLVIEVELGTINRWTWPELQEVLELCLEGRCPELQKPLPIMKLYQEWELQKRLFQSTVLVTWSGDEVGHVKRDDLPAAARAFLQQGDVETYQAIEERRRLKDQGLHFDGAWMPSTIRRVLEVLVRAGAYPPGSESIPWLFQERVTAENGALITLYEITRPSWGFSLRGLDQQEVIQELAAVCTVLGQSHC